MSSGGSEMGGFVFSVVFIIVFAALISSIPIGLQGPGMTPDTVIPIDPNLIAGFAESENWTRADYNELAGPIFTHYYDYDDFGGHSWRSYTDDATTLNLGRKDTFGPFWFGVMDFCTFKAPSEIDRGTTLEFTEIDTDAEDGVVSYSLSFTESGDAAGSFVVYWNSTAYATASDAWDNDELYLLHGLGVGTGATTNIGALIVSLLFLQLPDVPPLINILLATPIWACIIFVLWFIVKEMIPFV